MTALFLTLIPLLVGPTPPLAAAMNQPSQPSQPMIQPVAAAGAPSVPLRHLRTGHRLNLVLFDAHGHLAHSALAELRAFLTDPKADIDHPIHWRLATLLVAVAAHFPGRELEVVSGYRHTNKHHQRSKHTRGRALDFRVAGVANRELFDLLRRSFVDVGVGYYPNSTFIHLDVRDQSTLWVDYSGPGQTPCYSRTPHQDLDGGSAETLSYVQAQANGCRKP